MSDELVKGCKVRISDREGEYEVVTIAGNFIGVTGEDFAPKEKDQIVQFAVHRDKVAEIISHPVAQVEIESTPAPQINAEYF